MKSVTRGIEDYIELRRAYGLKFTAGESTLKSFGKFCKQHSHKQITISVILDWVHSFPDSTHYNISKKIMTLRGFTAYWKSFDPKTEIPPKHLSKLQTSRSNPHIFSKLEVLKILAALKKLKAERGRTNPIRPQTFFTMFGLIASCGLRRAEAINLKRKDVNFEDATILIEMTKFRKSRLIPLHPTTLQKLKEYADYRDKIIISPKCDNFFIMNRGQPVDGDSIFYAFVHACKNAGIRPTADGAGFPRIHDLRHTFVVRTIIRWLQEKKNVHEFMPVLSTYVGHASPSDTYWYLTAVPELMRFGLHERHR